MNEITKPTAAPPTRANFARLSDCKNLKEAFETREFKDRVAQGLPRHISPDRMLRTMVQAANRSPDIYRCDMRQAVGAFLTISQLGLEPNTPLGHVYMIPFKTKMWNPETRKRDIEGYELQVVIGYQGLAELTYRSGLVTNLHADVVYPGDEFVFEYGTNAGLRHVPMGQQKETDTPVWAYAHATLKDGQAFEVMPWSMVMRIRNSSQGYKAALAAKENAETKGWKVPATYTESPWVKHEAEMAKKTPFRRLSKWMPKSIELAGAVAMDELQDRGSRPDFGAIFDGTATAIDGVPEQIEHEQTIDTTATFGVREKEAAPVASQSAPQGASKPPATKPPPQQTKPVQRQPEPPPQVAPEQDQGDGWEAGPPAGMWDDEPAEEQQMQQQPTPPQDKPTPAKGSSGPWYFLADEHGELLADSHTQDPVKIARQVQAVLAEAEAAGETGVDFLAANRETIEAVIKASAEASEILADIELPDDGPAAEDDLLVKVQLNANGKPVLGGYVADVKRALVGIEGLEHLDTWLSVNQQTIDALPPATKIAVENAISEVRVKFDAQQQTAAPPPAAEEQPEAKPDPDKLWAERMVQDIEAARDARSLQEATGGTAIQTKVARFKAERPDLYALIRDAHRAKTTALKGGAT